MDRQSRGGRARRGYLAASLALIACCALATVAYAATINGTNGDDVLLGTGSKDTITAKGGDDLVFGNQGNDRIVGGLGHDELLGGNGADDIDADSGDDHLQGDGANCVFGEYPISSATVGISVIPVPCGPVSPDNPGGDRLDGDEGDDLLEGQEGDDILRGGGGIDDVFAGDDDDVVEGGTGEDSLYGGEGNDTLRSRDGRADYLDCGPGSDKVTADKTIDTIDSSCETVSVAVFKKGSKPQ